MIQLAEADFGHSYELSHRRKSDVESQTCSTVESKVKYTHTCINDTACHSPVFEILSVFTNCQGLER